MKILITAYACIPERGREGGRGWYLPWYLSKLGYEVWVMTRTDNLARIEQYLGSRSEPNLHIIPVAYPIWMNYGGKWNTPLKKLQYLAWQKQVYYAALKLDKKHKFDVVHHLTMASLQAGSRLAYLKKPFIFGPAGGGQTAPATFKKYFLTGWRTEALRSLFSTKLVLLNPWLRKTFSRTDLVLATNQETVELARQLGARNVELFLDGGLPQEYFSSAPPKRLSSQKLRLLWVASITPRKGLFLALEALSRVSSTIPFKLTIIGGGSLEGYVSEWIDNFNLKEKVDFRGRISWSEVKHAYLNSDVFLFTSLRDSYGTVMLEAMSQALPIITLNHHGAKSFVPERAGIKVPVDNPNETVNALARAVEYMYNNPEERLKMGQVGYDFALTQTWKQKAIKISSYYEYILNNHSKIN